MNFYVVCLVLISFLGSKCSNTVIVVPPMRFLRVFGAGFDVECIVRGSRLFLSRGQHGDNGEADGLHRQGRRPIIRQDWQTDVAVTVDMLVHWDVFRDPHECNLGRVEGIFVVEFELDDELFTVVERVTGSDHLHFPNAEIISLESFLVQLQSVRRRAHKTLQFFLEPLESRPTDLLIPWRRHGASWGAVAGGAGRTDRWGQLSVGMSLQCHSPFPSLKPLSSQDHTPDLTTLLPPASHLLPFNIQSVKRVWYYWHSNIKLQHYDWDSRANSVYTNCNNLGKYNHYITLPVTLSSA